MKRKETTTRIIYILIICSMPPLLTQINVILSPIHYLLHDRRHLLCQKINNELAAYNYGDAQKTIAKLAKWEEKQRSRTDLQYRYSGRSSEYYQSLVNEAIDDYQTALALRQEYGDLISSHLGRKGYYDYYAIPRLLFKLKRRKDSFREFCKVTSVVKNTQLINFDYFTTDKYGCVSQSYSLSQDAKGSEEFQAICRNIRDRITYNPPINKRPARYISFPEFLKFAEEEYAKLGAPQEYADAMEVFRSVNAELARSSKGKGDENEQSSRKRSNQDRTLRDGQ